MPTKKTPDGHDRNTRDRAIALGKALRMLREERQLSRAELLDRFYTELESEGINYKVKGDWWLTGIENGDKAKQLPREYIDAFIRALKCTRLEATHLLILADLNTLPNLPNTSYTTGLTYVFAELFTAALKALEARIDEATAARLSERAWMEIGRAVLQAVAAGDTV
ncbi:MAG TPA: hypothetical protein VFZ66_28460 [Herpetosiphonaceae bacterium]